MNIMKNFEFFLSKSKLNCGVICFVMMVLCPGAATAYHQEIGADVQEVYAAVLKVFSPYGIVKQDDKNFEIETDWVEAKTERVKTFLGRVKTRKNYFRRTKYWVSLKRWPRYTEIDIRTEFRFKPSTATMSTPWKKMKPEFSDYELEREAFRDVLSQIESARRGISAK